MKRTLRYFAALVVFVVLAFVGGFHLSSPPAEAGMICEDGRWQDWKMHCQLGTAVNCTECWVWPK